MTEEQEVPLTMNGKTVGTAKVRFDGADVVVVSGEIQSEKLAGDFRAAFSVMTSGMFSLDPRELIDNKRPCMVYPGGGRNVNICVAEGCYGNSCLEKKED
jgi:hypothetical protein